MGSDLDAGIKNNHSEPEPDSLKAETPAAQHPEYYVDNPGLLLQGTYTQVGFDLVITGSGGEQLVIGDYFTFQPPPNLMFAPGIGISPVMVEGLLVQVQPEYQLAGPAPDDVPMVKIGTVSVKVGNVFRENKTTGEKEALSKGDDLYKGDILSVEGLGGLYAKMTDGTRFNLGANSRAVLKDYAFDPQAETGTFSAHVLQGGFKYKSGLIGKFSAKRGATDNHATISTPSAVIGIRGSELEGNYDPVSLQTTVIHRSGLLTVTDINGNNPTVLAVSGNAATILIGGNPQFVSQASPQQQAAIQQALPPATNEEEVEDTTEEEGEEAQEGEGDEPGEGEETEGEGDEEASEDAEEQSGAEGEEEAEAEEDAQEEEEAEAEEDAQEEKKRPRQKKTLKRKKRRR